MTKGASWKTQVFFWLFFVEAGLLSRKLLASLIGLNTPRAPPSTSGFVNEKITSY
jgi:hypothetical protein